MRVIKTYYFYIGSKIPYSEWPAIVHQYLADQGLVSHRFMYYFEELLDSRKSPDDRLLDGSCAKAVKDCPALGEVRFLNGGASGVVDHLLLSNIDRDTACTEADLLPLMKKIHRRYGFTESVLYYYDIDFFQDVIPFERDLAHAKAASERHHLALEPALFLSHQPYGSGIRLHRNIVGGSTLCLSVDLLHNGEVLDPTPYFEAMRSLLPNIRHADCLKIYFSEEEKQSIAVMNDHAAPTLEQCRDFFSQRLPSSQEQNLFQSNYSIATKLKKLAKQYGFTYQYQGCGMYALDKRTARGHVLRFGADSGPSHYDTTFGLDLSGIGFNHTLLSWMQTPTNQQEFDACAEQAIAVVSEFEKTLLPSLDVLFPETPDWFVPEY